MITMLIKDVKAASEILRACDDGRIVRSDGTTAVHVEPLAFREAAIVLSGVHGPFSTAHEAEDKAVAALRGWNDRTRQAYWNR